MVHRVYISFGAQAVVANWLQTFKEFPIRQKPASFNLDEVMRKLTPPSNAGGVPGCQIGSWRLHGWLRLADYTLARSNPSHLLIAVTFKCKGACFGCPQSSITSSFASWEDRILITSESVWPSAK